MGCDIHSYVEQQDSTGQWQYIPGDWPDDGPFGWRSYGTFGFLADVRNSSCVPPLAARRGLPADLSIQVIFKRQEDDAITWTHSTSWLTVDELSAFDYDATFEDRRITVGSDGQATAQPGGGKTVTYREFLGESFFQDLNKLQKLNEQRPTRIVFWFDN